MIYGISLNGNKLIWTSEDETDAINKLKNEYNNENYELLKINISSLKNIFTLYSEIISHAYDLDTNEWIVYEPYYYLLLDGNRRIINFMKKIPSDIPKKYLYKINKLDSEKYITKLDPVPKYLLLEV